MSRFKHGFLLGKFLPLHAGHSRLIESALSMCDRVTVQLLGSRREPIPLQTREAWLRELHPATNVVAAYDEVKVDFNDPAVWDAHMEIIESHLDSPVDAVFTSDDYGAELARRLDAQWIQVDPGRKEVPISGTEIRRNPYENWKWISPAVRAWYARRIVILGAESTGTTTLANSLGRALECEVVPEYGREWSEIRPGGLSAQWLHDELRLIAERQRDLEEAAARNSANGWIVCDTDSFATALWEERYVGSMSSLVSEIASALPKRRVYVLTGDEIPWIDDGLRDGEHIRSSMQERFRQELQKQDRPWMEVRGDLGVRLSKTVSFIEDAFREMNLTEP